MLREDEMIIREKKIFKAEEDEIKYQKLTLKGIILIIAALWVFVAKN